MIYIQIFAVVFVFYIIVGTVAEMEHTAVERTDGGIGDTRKHVAVVAVYKVVHAAIGGARDLAVTPDGGRITHQVIGKLLVERILRSVGFEIRLSGNRMRK